MKKDKWFKDGHEYLLDLKSNSVAELYDFYNDNKHSAKRFI